MASTRPRRSKRVVLYDEESDPDLSESMEYCLSTVAEAGQGKNQDDSLGELIRQPTEEEVAQRRKAIVTTTAAIAKVDAEYLKTKKMLESVQAKRSALDDELLKHRAYVSRLRALPQEVLQVIFLAYTEDPSEPPWTLAHVSKMWRATAFGTSNLWAKIMLGSPAWQWDGGARWKDGKEICGSSEQLARALRRAGNSSLAITVNLCNPRQSARRDYDRIALLEMLERLSTSPKSTHVHHLEIQGGSIWFPHWKLSLPNLKSIIVATQRQTDEIAELASQSDQLSSVHVRLNTPSSISGTGNLCGVPKYTAMRSLTSLYLDGTGAGIFSRTVSRELYLALGSTRSQIRDLEMRSLRLSIDESLSLHMPKLESLVLHRVQLWPLVAPLLSSLKAMWSELAQSDTSAMDLSLLSSLSIPATYIGQPPDYLQNAQLNGVITLEITGGSLQGTRLNFRTKLWSLNPSILLLKDISITSAALNILLSSLTRIETLDFQGFDIAPDFFSAFNPKQPRNSKAAKTAATSAFYPLLTNIRVDLSSGPRHLSRGRLLMAGRRAMKARIDAGIEMKKASIRISEERGWSDLL